MTVAERWPSLPLAEWRDTANTLHLWTQIVGKVRLALAPMVNHWWNVPLYVSARGLTTSAMPYGAGVVELTFDFHEHALRVETSWGEARSVQLRPRSVADFYRDVMATLKAAGVNVRIMRRPVELEHVIPLDEDDVHASYDAAAAAKFWQMLIDVDRVLHEFRGRFIGKCSPVHFWWGSFDIAVTRFSGRGVLPRADAGVVPAIRSSPHRARPRCRAAVVSAEHVRRGGDARRVGPRRARAPARLAHPVRNATQKRSAESVHRRAS